MTESETKELEFSEFCFRAEMIDRDKADKVRYQMIAASYTAWQQISAQGGKMNWIEYLDALGLSEKPRTIGKEAKKAMIDRALNIADRIEKAKINE